MSSSPCQRIPQITKTIQNWWILMDEGKTKSATALAFTKFTEKEMFFREFHHVQFTRSNNPQITKCQQKVQNWWIQMKLAVKARRPDEECHSLSFYQINNKKIVFCEFVNSSMSSSPGQRIFKSPTKFRIGWPKWRT